MSNSPMDEMLTDVRTAEQALSTSGRRPYASPRLTIYGTVRTLTTGNATVGADGTNSRKNPQSDRATKQDIVRVGTHPLGFGLYLFSYRPEFRDRCGHGRQFGVMADEVQAIVPAAVSLGSNGYRQVDYGLLGIH